MTMHPIQIEDSEAISALSFIDWERLRGAAVLITGATGLIGSNLVNALAFADRQKGLGLRLILPVRNVAAAEKKFGWTGARIVPYALGSKPEGIDPVEYIVHLASPTSSRFFTEQPVDTLMDNIDGLRAWLEFAKAHPVRKLVFLSSMEVYGFPQKGHRVKEGELGAFETMNARNSYPLAKMACEALCNSYHVQYGVPAVVLRATQTFGPGVQYEDGRVFAEFMRCAVEKRDIVLKTAGDTERSYLYTADAVSAILVSMLKAQPGQAYTVANPDTYCSIRDMAQMVADVVAGGKIRVTFDIAPDAEKLGYARTLHMDLDVEKLQSLGWTATTGLEDMFRRMIMGLEADA